MSMRHPWANDHRQMTWRIAGNQVSSVPLDRNSTEAKRLECVVMERERDMIRKRLITVFTHSFYISLQVRYNTIPTPPALWIDNAYTKERGDDERETKMKMKMKTKKGKESN